MTNTTLLEQYIDQSGYKKSYIAAQLGITSYAFALKINNKSEFKANEIDILCKLLNISVKDRMRIFFARKVDQKSTKKTKQEEKQNERIGTNRRAGGTGDREA